MKGVRELKARLKSVTNIKKITRAMELVAATKLRRLQDRALATRPFADGIEAMMRRVAAVADISASPLLQPVGSVQREAVVVIGADRGLCGAYNSNLHRAARKHLLALEDAGVESEVWTFGRRATGFLTKIQANPSWTFDGSMEKLEYPDVRSVLRGLVQSYTEGRIQRVTVVGTRMRSLAVFKPQVDQLLPIAPPEAAADDTDSASGDYLLEPSPQVLLDRLVPRHLEMTLYAALLEALACEFAARRMAMKNATDNAEEMLGALRMEYNKARQQGITGELLDIVGAVVGLDG